MKYALTATCSLGLEAVVARELKALNVEEVHSENGQVSFLADAAGLCRANMWLRSADRVWMKVGEFPADTFEDLYQNTRMLHWEHFLPGNAAFPVYAHSHGSALTSIPAIQRTVKKAIVETMQQRYRCSWLPEDGALFPVRAFLVDNMCSMMLDTSGTGLHRRGYHTMNTAAPLRETLAAALVQLSYYRKNRTLLDPFCGSGTIAIEAAMLELKRAPGLNRSFACERWPMIGAKVWQETRNEAQEAFDRHTTLDIRGYDCDPEVLQLANTHLRQSGLEQRGIRLERRDIREFSTRGLGEYGVIITNPPYGERLLERDEARELFGVLGAACNQLPSWSHYVICSDPEFVNFFGRAPIRKRKVYNGMMACTYYQYPGPRPPRQEA